MKGSEHKVRQVSLTRILCIIIVLLLSQQSCSVKQFAINTMAESLAEGGSVFASDEDPLLIEAAIPFSLKLIEALMAESPENENLLLAASRGFTQYSYGFVHLRAKRMAIESSEEAAILNDRAKKLYLRAQRYGMSGLEVRHPGFQEKLRSNPSLAVAKMKKEDVPFLYWTAASWGGAISVDKNDYSLIAEIPQMEALILKALELEPEYEAGAIHIFLITFEMTRTNAPGNPSERARQHFDAALEISDGLLASPYISLAEAVAVQEQNLAEFQRSLGQAIDIDTDVKPDWRLENKLMQEHARWLLDMTDEFFLLPLDEANEPDDL